MFRVILRDRGPGRTDSVTESAEQPVDWAEPKPNRRWPRLGAVVAVLALLGLAAWYLIDMRGGSSDETASASAEPVALSADGLKTLAGSLGQPVYWLGEQPNTTYEVMQSPDGRVYVRYLPAGTEAGDPRAFTTVGTYAVRNAYEIIDSRMREPGASAISVSGGGVALVTKTSPTNVYVAYPGSDYQIEIFSPVRNQARELVESGASAGGWRAAGAGNHLRCRGRLGEPPEGSRSIARPADLLGGGEAEDDIRVHSRSEREHLRSLPPDRHARRNVETASHRQHIPLRGRLQGHEGGGVEERRRGDSGRWRGNRVLQPEEADERLRRLPRLGVSDRDLLADAGTGPRAGRGRAHHAGSLALRSRRSDRRRDYVEQTAYAWTVTVFAAFMLAVTIAVAVKAVAELGAAS